MQEGRRIVFLTESGQSVKTSLFKGGPKGANHINTNKTGKTEEPGRFHFEPGKRGQVFSPWLRFNRHDWVEGAHIQTCLTSEKTIPSNGYGSKTGIPKWNPGKWKHGYQNLRFAPPV